ncbi:MAG: glycosyltransferase, partial [Symploca sp. SIO2D2]|nr:glycosyltransferase [Symploca sp. SIO2D2]
MAAETISIIIPVINEATTIKEVLVRLSSIQKVEVIVVDGGSQDETRTIAQSLGV